MSKLNTLLEQIAERHSNTANDIKKQIFSKSLKLIFIDEFQRERTIKTDIDLIDFLKAEIKDLELYIEDIQNEQKNRGK
jgi:hypothetical protein